MQHKSKKNAVVLLLAIISLVASMFLLSACDQSTDKSESYFDTSGIASTKCEYDSVNNTTKVVWASTLTNGTIYNIKGFSVTFKLYNNSILVGTQTYHYSTSIKHGKDYMGAFNFICENEVNSIEYISWSADYDSFWGTYKIWFIATLVIVLVASLIYIIFMIIEDFDLSDTVDFLRDHGWLFVVLIAPLAGAIWGLVESYWVPVLIVLGGLVALVLIILLAHLIQYIIEVLIEKIEMCGGPKQYECDDDSDGDGFDPDCAYVKDYVKDKDTLMLFRVEQLKEYCRKNNIRGYSGRNKASLVDLILTRSEDMGDGEKDSKPTSSKKPTQISFDDIAGLEDAKRAFREKVINAFEHKELYEKYGKKVGGGILLYGLPGTGKTMFAEAASNETESLFLDIKCSDIKSKWYGESELKVKSIFEKARKAKRAIIFFDEFEAIGAKRTEDCTSGNNDLVPQILVEMQGYGSNSATSTVLVIAATNKPWAIDSAFLRPGRFYEKIYIPLPDFEARKKMFEIKLHSIPQKGLDYDYLARITEGFNGADIGAFCEKLKMIVINKSIDTNEEYPIEMSDVEVVKDMIKSSVSQEDVELLLEFKQQYG